jgi:hypothetical protein
MKNKYPLHPFFLALYPILFLFAHNIDRIPVYEPFRIILLQELITGFLLGLLWVVCRNWHRSALVVSLTLILFSSFGHLYSYLSGTLMPNSIWSQANVLAALWAAAFILMSWWFLRKLRNPLMFTQVLNITSAILLIFPLLNIISFGSVKF